MAPFFGGLCRRPLLLWVVGILFLTYRSNASTPPLDSSGVQMSVVYPASGDPFRPLTAVDIHLTLAEGHEADTIRAQPALFQVCWILLFNPQPMQLPPPPPYLV